MVIIRVSTTYEKTNGVNYNRNGDDHGFNNARNNNWINQNISGNNHSFNNAHNDNLANFSETGNNPIIFNNLKNYRITSNNNRPVYHLSSANDSVQAAFFLDKVYIIN